MDCRSKSGPRRNAVAFVNEPIPMGLCVSSSWLVGLGFRVGLLHESFFLSRCSGHPNQANGRVLGLEVERLGV